jgi:hypothetical protein
MRLSKAILVAALVIGAAQMADARTTTASAGRATTGTQDANFNVLSTGVSTPVAGARTLSIPITLDTAGSKGFIVRGNPSGVTCTATERGSVPIFNSVTVPVSAPGAIVFATFLPQLVTAGNTVMMNCTFTNTTGRVLLVDHN